MTEQSNSSILRADGLIKRFKKRTVVKDVSLYVKQGEIVGLLGPNGAGKTTTFYMMVGMIKPTHGQVILDEKEITSKAMYKRSRYGISYLPQEASIFRKLSVENNIKAVLQLQPLKRKNRAERLEELLADFGINHIRKSKGYMLSGGERRRCEISRTLASNPKFILLDEPFAGIDPIAISDIRKLVRQLTARGIGVLVTDHNVRETLELIDTALIIHEGQVLTEGTPQEIVSNPDVRRYYLGADFSL